MTGKWTLRRVADGALFEHWPVDARAMLDSGEFELEAPDAAAVAALAVIGGGSEPPATGEQAEHPAGGPLKVAKKEDASAPAPPDLSPARRTGKKA